MSKALCNLINVARTYGSASCLLVYLELKDLSWTRWICPDGVKKTGLPITLVLIIGNLALACAAAVRARVKITCIVNSIGKKTVAEQRIYLIV